MREQLLHTWFTLFESYLTEQQFNVMCEEAIINCKNILTGVPQGSVLEFILHLLYTTDVPTDNSSMTTMFADDTAILTISKNQQAAMLIYKSKTYLIWMRRWKIQINSEKLVHFA